MVFAYVPDVVSKMDGLIGRSLHNPPRFIDHNYLKVS